MKLVFRTYLTHLPSAFDIEEDVVTNVLLGGGGGRYPAGKEIIVSRVIATLRS